MKTKLLNYYYRNGERVGKFMLVSTAIATVLALALIVLGKFNFSDSMAMVLAVPIIALLVILTRLVLKLIYKVSNIRSSILKSVIALFAFAVCGMGISPIFRAMDGLPEFVLGIIYIGYDIVFLGVMVLLLMATKFKNKTNTIVMEESQ